MTRKKPRDPYPPFKFSQFHVPPQANPKNVTSTYLRSEANTIWKRNASNAKPPQQEEDEAQEAQGSRTIIIHPGSETLRIGRATDYSPVQVPSVIARRRRQTEDAAAVGSLKGKERASEDISMDVDVPEEDDQMTLKIQSLRQTLLYRTTALKLQSLPHAHGLAVAYNETSEAVNVEDYNDPFRVEWNAVGDRQIIVGADCAKIDPDGGVYEVRRPWENRVLNERQYSSNEQLVRDAEDFLRIVLETELKLTKASLKDYSVILVIPDHVPKRYLREMSQILLLGLGFRQLCIQQESLGASFGAGLSSACVIDIGAHKTSIACVEDGMVLPETRHTLSYAGADITRFLEVVFRASSYSFKDCDLRKSYDFNVIQELKEKLCTLSEAQVGVNVYEFFSRRPGQPTKKYSVKAFDEVILAPMCLFEPRVVDFAVKTKSTTSRTIQKDLVDEGEYTLDAPTLAMNMSTYHLRPVAPPVPATVPEPSATPTPGDTSAPASSPVGAPAPLPPVPSVPAPPPPPPEPEPLAFDIVEEAGKVPLEVALCNAIVASGPSEDRVRRMCASLLLVGGTSHLPALGYALQSRLLPIMASRYPAIQAIQVIPPPRELDARVLVWKGISVLARLESLGGDDAFGWVSKDEWEVLGMRALRERTLFW